MHLSMTVLGTSMAMIESDYWYYYLRVRVRGQLQVIMVESHLVRDPIGLRSIGLGRKRLESLYCDSTATG